MFENDEDESSNETFSQECNEDGSVNEARERALERNARLVYEDYTDVDSDG
jgi:hypothetical protein